MVITHAPDGLTTIANLTTTRLTFHRASTQGPEAFLRAGYGGER
ncbi:hypothetical protein Pd630_LPD03953 [Rhodococcus opacus PD630]|nr:hypothetical protein Pd630_LPD03953 [Rhodococcus opacus PD630]